MDEEEFLDEMINEAVELGVLLQDVEGSLNNAASVECMDDMLANLDDAKHALKSLAADLDIAHTRARRFVQEKGRANRAH